MQIGASLRVLGIVADVVVSEHIVKGDTEDASQEGKIFRRHISAGEDEIHSGETGRRLPVVEDRLHSV
jgi:hypothetical protein